MIGKTGTGKGFGGCVGYCLDESKQAEILDKNNIIHDDAKGISKEFQAICDENRNVSKPVWHTSLSFPKEDNISKDQMKEVASRFMEKAGFTKENNQYVTIMHNDRDHSHVHIVANRIGFDGKAVSDSYCKSRTVKWSKELEQEFKLTKVQDLKKENNQIRDKVKTIEHSKQHIKEAVDSYLNKPGTKSIQEFNQQLNNKNIELQIHKHAQTGKEYGISYKKGDLSFKGSELGKQYSFQSINNKISNKKEISRSKGYSKGLKL